MGFKGRRETSQNTMLELAGKLLGFRPFYGLLAYIFELPTQVRHFSRLLLGRCFKLLDILLCDFVISCLQVCHLSRQSRDLPTKRFRRRTVSKLIKMMLRDRQLHA